MDLLIDSGNQSQMFIVDVVLSVPSKSHYCYPEIITLLFLTVFIFRVDFFLLKVKLTEAPFLLGGS